MVCGKKLYVDGNLQDENLGLALRAALTGKIKNDHIEAKDIKVTMGGNFKVNCKYLLVMSMSSLIKLE